MKPSTQQTNGALSQSQNEIARTAYRLWEQAGRPPGRNMEFWLKAEQQYTLTGGLLSELESAQTPDQAHANQFFESLRSIKFTAVTKPAVQAIKQMSPGPAKPDQTSKPGVARGKSQRKGVATGSTEALQHGK